MRVLITDGADLLLLMMVAVDDTAAKADGYRSVFQTSSKQSSRNGAHGIAMKAASHADGVYFKNVDQMIGWMAML